jgi:hypothetical protein
MFITVQGLTDFVIIIPDCPKPDLKYCKNERGHDPMKQLRHCEQILQVHRSVQNEFPWFSCRCRNDSLYFTYKPQRVWFHHVTLLWRVPAATGSQRWYFASWARWRTATFPYREYACQCHVFWRMDWTWGTCSMDPISPALTSLDSSLQISLKCIYVVCMTQVCLSLSLTILTFSFQTLSFLYCSCQKDERVKPGNLLINWCSFSPPPPLGWGLSLF